MDWGLCGGFRCKNLHWVEPPDYEERKRREKADQQRGRDERQLLARPTHFSIYGIVRRSDRLLLYIGKTSKTPERRLADHIRDDVPLGSRWQRWLHSNRDVDLDVFTLETVPLSEPKTAAERESDWIERSILAGCDLWNTMVRHGLDVDKLRRRAARSSAGAAA